MKVNSRYYGKPNYLLSACFQSLRETPNMDVSCKIFINIFVRKIRLIQPMVITLKGMGVNRVMVSFCRSKLFECKRQLYASI